LCRHAHIQTWCTQPRHVAGVWCACAAILLRGSALGRRASPCRLSLPRTCLRHQTASPVRSTSPSLCERPRPCNRGAPAMAGAMPCFKVHVAVKLQDIWAIIDPLSEDGDESADLLRQVSRQPALYTGAGPAARMSMGTGSGRRTSAIRCRALPPGSVPAGPLLTRQNRQSA